MSDTSLNTVNSKNTQFEIKFGSYVLTSQQFDEFYEYLAQRGNCRFDLHERLSQNNDEFDVKTVQIEQPRELSGDTMFDTVYVKTTPNHMQKVDIMVKWFRSTKFKEMLYGTEEWLKK